MIVALIVATVSYKFEIPPGSRVELPVAVLMLESVRAE